MRYMNIGKSGIKASVISLGSLSMSGGVWWNSDDAESVRTINDALDAGINLIDTAPLYGFGHAEEIIGKTIKGRRSDVVISTKCGMLWGTTDGRYLWDKGDEKIYLNDSEKAIREDLFRSLKRLDTDYVDILYTHNPDNLTPVEETVNALQKLKKEGYIRAIGSSNVKPENIREYIAAGCEIDIVQRLYNLVDRLYVEQEILPVLRENAISFHGYSPLERGLLAGKSPRTLSEPQAKRRWWQLDTYPLALAFADGLKDFAEKYNATLAELSIAFLLAQGEDINVICGAHKPEQLQADIHAVDLKLDSADVAEIARLEDELEKKISELKSE